MFRQMIVLAMRDIPQKNIYLLLPREKKLLMIRGSDC